MDQFDFGNLGGLLGGFQSKIAEMQAKQKALRVTGTAGGGLVTVVATGEFEIVSVTITEEAYQDRELLEDLVRAATDEALRQVAGFLTAATSPGDLVGRLGGDEFVVIRAVDDVGSAVRCSDELLAGLIAILRPLGEHPGSVGASAGLSVAPATEIDVDGLLREADSALISVKTGDKGTVRLSNRLETV